MKIHPMWSILIFVLLATYCTEKENKSVNGVADNEDQLEEVSEEFFDSSINRVLRRRYFIDENGQRQGDHIVMTEHGDTFGAGQYFNDTLLGYYEYYEDGKLWGKVNNKFKYGRRSMNYQIFYNHDGTIDSSRSVWFATSLDIGKVEQVQNKKIDFWINHFSDEIIPHHAHKLIIHLNGTILDTLTAEPLPLFKGSLGPLKTGVNRIKLESKLVVEDTIVGEDRMHFWMVRELLHFIRVKED